MMQQQTRTVPWAQRWNTEYQPATATAAGESPFAARAPGPETNARTGFQWPWQRSTPPAEPAEPDFDYMRYNPDIARAGGVSAEVGRSFMESMQPDMRAVMTADAQQTEEMNRRRQLWFDQWKALMHGAYQQKADTLVAGRGMFTSGLAPTGWSA